MQWSNRAAPTRDAAEGAAVNSVADSTGEKTGTHGASKEAGGHSRGGLTPVSTLSSATPKPAPPIMRERFQYDTQPAPDAMREAQLQQSERVLREALLQQSRRVRNFSNPDDTFEAVPTRFITEASETITETAPVPSPDGAGGHGIQCNLCGETLHNNELCNDAECPIGGSFKVVPSATGAAEPVAWQRRWRVIGEKDWNYGDHPAWLDNGSLEFETATPPVRGDRELLEQCAKIAQQFELDMSNSRLDDRDIENIKRGASEASSAIEQAILSLPVQPGAGERDYIAGEIQCILANEQSVDSDQEIIGAGPASFKIADRVLSGDWR